MKLQNNSDSAWRAKTKFVWQLGRYEPSYSLKLPSLGLYSFERWYIYQAPLKWAKPAYFCLFSSFYFKNGPSPASFSLFSSFQYTVDSKQMFNINFCRWLDSNRGPLELEATALTTEPQPRPLFSSFSQHIDKYSTNLTINGISDEKVLGIWTWDQRMAGADESTERLPRLLVNSIQWSTVYYNSPSLNVLIAMSTKPPIMLSSFELTSMQRSLQLRILLQSISIQSIRNHEWQSKQKFRVFSQIGDRRRRRR